MRTVLAGVMACTLALGAWGCAGAKSESKQIAAQMAEHEQRVAEWAEATVAEPRVLTAFAAPAADAIDPPNPRLTNAINDFGIALLGEVTRSSSSSAPANIVLSPFSAHTALSMVANGARGETATEILATLGLSDTPFAQTNQRYGEALNFLEFLNARGQTRVAVVNSMWPDARMEVEPAFVETTKEFFGAQLETVDTLDPQTAAERINAWVAEQTGGKVTGAVTPDSLDPTALTLLNTLDFAGTWSGGFDSAHTRDGSFRLADSATALVPLMSRKGLLDYAEKDTLQAIYLPYDGGTGMWVVLPPHSEGEDPAASLAEWVGALDAKTWKSLTASVRPREGRIDMPRYSLRSRTDLTAPLQALGMRSAFDDIGADLSGIAPSPALNITLFISSVVQETMLAVDEEGTEAAAVTAVPTFWNGDPEQPDDQPFEMIVDRPFLVAIDLEDGPLLFLGAIYDPR